MSETATQPAPTTSHALMRGEGGSKYSDEQRIEAIGHYLVLGNMSRVSDALGIPKQTLSEWAQSEWWHRAIGQVRTERNEDLDCRLSNAVDRALDGLLDRMDNGDAQVIDGELRKVPVKGRDLAVMFGVMFDKRQLLRSMPTSINASAGTIDALAGRMVTLLQRAAAPTEIDVTPAAPQQP